MFDVSGMKDCCVGVISYYYYLKRTTSLATTEVCHDGVQQLDSGSDMDVFTPTTTIPAQDGNMKVMEWFYSMTWVIILMD